MTSLTKNLHPQPKIFFQVQATRLAASFQTDQVSSIYRSGEVSVQSHVRFSVFFSEIPTSARTPKC